MTGTRRRRIGMVGAEQVSAYHLSAWRRQLHRAEVVAIADPSRSTIEARLAAFEVARNYAGAEAMLEAEQLDAVDICAPREFHAELVRLAAARGSILSARSRSPLPTTRLFTCWQSFPARAG